MYIFMHFVHAHWAWFHFWLAIVPMFRIYMSRCIYMSLCIYISHALNTIAYAKPYHAFASFYSILGIPCARWTC